MAIGANKSRYLAYFEKTYKKKLNTNFIIHGTQVHRYDGFRKIFETLLNNKNGGFTIVETGALRIKHNWTDGQSSLLFYEFLALFGGKLISIDNDKDAIKTCGEILSEEVPKTGKAGFTLIKGDSIKELSRLDEHVDLLYLDTYDIDINNPNLSMEHYLKELAATDRIITKSKDLLVATDDNFEKFGKGKFIIAWAKKTNQDILLENFQTLVRVRNNSLD